MSEQHFHFTPWNWVHAPKWRNCFSACKTSHKHKQGSRYSENRTWRGNKSCCV